MYISAVVPTQSNVIEAGQNMTYDNEKEWYYGTGDERKGPVTFSEVRITKCFFILLFIRLKINILFCRLQLQELYKTNTLHSRTKCWAQGMDGWRLLQQITQLKWTLFAKGTPILNESELASTLLSILIRICQFFPSR